MWSIVGRKAFTTALGVWVRTGGIQSLVTAYRDLRFAYRESVTTDLYSTLDCLPRAASVPAFRRAVSLRWFLLTWRNVESTALVV